MGMGSTVVSNARNHKLVVAVDTHVTTSPTSPVTSEHAQTEELTAATTLDDLFKAILGHEAGEVDDRALLLETVEAQVQGIRDELGLPEPVVEVEPPPVPLSAPRQDIAPMFGALGASGEPTHAASNGVRSVGKRVPELFKFVAGLAWSRLPHPVVVLAVTGGLLALS